MVQSRQHVARSCKGAVAATLRPQEMHDENPGDSTPSFGGYRQVGRFLALENAINVAGRAAVLVAEIGPLGDQAATSDVGSRAVDRR
jgi:hypothetical protein